MKNKFIFFLTICLFINISYYDIKAEEFIDYEIDPARYSINECLQRGLTYKVPLKVPFKGPF